MTRISFTLCICVILLLTSCSPSKKQFGQIIINSTADTLASKQKIVKIKSLSNDVFEQATFAGKDRIEIKYRLFKPIQNQATAVKYPLVVVYHGSGSVGIDNTSQLGVLQKLFANPHIQKKYPAYVLAPQFPTRSSDYVLDSSLHVLTSTPRACLNSALQLIDSLKKNLNIDTNRIYVVGFSMGGSTVINSLSARPGLFAAGISIAGIPQFDKIKDLTAIPIWLIHGIDDTENPTNSDERFYEEIKNSHNIRFWKLKGITHNTIFTTQLLGETLPKWLFKQRKK